MPTRNMETYLKLTQLADFENDLTSEKAQTAMLDAYTDDFVLVEPPSLPHGGTHRGKEQWLKVHEIMRSLWQQKVHIEHLWEVPEDDVILLHTTMEWTAVTTGKTVTFPAIEVLKFRDGKIAGVDMFLQDTKVILDTLE